VVLGSIRSISNFEKVGPGLLTGIHLSCSGAKIVPLIFYLLHSIALDIL
jgi:hypothetical protein